MPRRDGLSKGDVTRWHREDWEELEQELAWCELSLPSLVPWVEAGLGSPRWGFSTSFRCAWLTSAFLFPLDIKYSALYRKQFIKQAIPSAASNKEELGPGSPL